MEGLSCSWPDPLHRRGDWARFHPPRRGLLVPSQDRIGFGLAEALSPQGADGLKEAELPSPCKAPGAGGWGAVQRGRNQLVQEGAVLNPLARQEPGRVALGWGWGRAGVEAAVAAPGDWGRKDSSPSSFLCALYLKTPVWAGIVAVPHFGIKMSGNTMTVF